MWTTGDAVLTRPWRTAAPGHGVGLGAFGHQRLPVRHALLTLLLVSHAACLDPAGLDGPEGRVYSVEYRPPRVVSVASVCDRMLTEARVAFHQSDRTFDMALAIREDCREPGPASRDWQVVIGGAYLSRKGEVEFTPTGSTGPFEGRISASVLRLTLPPRPDSVAPIPLELELAQHR